MINKLLKPQPNFAYPSMRDPSRNPKCYDMTDQERVEAVKRLDQLLQKNASEAKRSSKSL